MPHVSESVSISVISVLVTFSLIINKIEESFLPNRSLILLFMEINVLLKIRYKTNLTSLGTSFALAFSQIKSHVDPH